MRISALKAAAPFIAGAACSSTVLSAAPAPTNTTKGQSQSEASAPASGATAQSPAPAAASGTSATTPASGSTAQNPVQLNDAEILGCVLAVDENEVAAATAAEKKKMGSEAMAFAKMLRKEHKADEKKTRKLAKQIGAKPAESKTSEQLRTKGKEDLAALSSKEGADFEKAYIEAMVNGHTDALSLIDGTLIPNAKNEAVKNHLTEVRTHVSTHLEHGKRLQGAQASKGE